MESALAAKKIATISHLTSGRVAVNIVSGWFRGEFTAIGEPWLDHDERYRRSEEFIRALRGIWTEDTFTFGGDFYRFRDYSLRPKPIEPPSGDLPRRLSSRAARDMASGFPTGISPTATRRTRSGSRSTTSGQRPTRTIIRCDRRQCFRDCPRTASSRRSAVLDEIIAKANPDAVHGFAAPGQECQAKLHRRVRGTGRNRASKTSVQYNDGFRSNLIGTPEQIAERILRLKDAGASLILLGFLHFQEEVEFFGTHVIPRVRALKADRRHTLAAAE